MYTNNNIMLFNSGDLTNIYLYISFIMIYEYNIITTGKTASETAYSMFQKGIFFLNIPQNLAA